MKKIVGIIAAVAMAASVFAADIAVSGKLKITGDLFNYSNDSFKVLNQTWHNDGTGASANVYFGTTSDDGKAGASMTYLINEWAWDYTSAVKTSDVSAIKDFNVWFKPFDMLKISLNATDAFTAELAPMDGLTWSVIFGTAGAGSYWFDGKNMYKLATKVVYTNDSIGTISARFAGKDNFKTFGGWVKYTNAFDFGKITAFFSDYFDHDTWKDPMECWTDDDDNVTSFKTLTFGAQYENTFDPITVKLGAVARVNGSDLEYVSIINKFSGVHDAFSWDISADPCKLFITPKADPVIGLKANAYYQLDALKAYFNFEAANLLNIDSGLWFKPGVSGNYGVIAWDVGVRVDIKPAIAVSVPFSLAVTF